MQQRFHHRHRALQQMKLFHPHRSSLDSRMGHAWWLSSTTITRSTTFVLSLMFLDQGIQLTTPFRSWGSHQSHLLILFRPLIKPVSQTLQSFRNSRKFHFFSSSMHYKDILKTWDCTENIPKLFNRLIVGREKKHHMVSMFFCLNKCFFHCRYLSHITRVECSVTKFFNYV